MKIYCYSRCTTCKKALKWLDDHGIDYELKDIKADHPDYDWKMCINESKCLTMGHKGELFVLDLSFFGWFFVGALCLGVGTFWVTPYMEATKAHFYQNLLILDTQAGAMQ